jgi:hypothetical protein
MRVVTQFAECTSTDYKYIFFKKIFIWKCYVVKYEVAMLCVRSCDNNDFELFTLRAYLGSQSSEDNVNSGSLPNNSRSMTLSTFLQRHCDINMYIIITKLYLRGIIVSAWIKCQRSMLGLQQYFRNTDRNMGNSSLTWNGLKKKILVSHFTIFFTAWHV